MAVMASPRRSTMRSRLWFRIASNGVGTLAFRFPEEVEVHALVGLGDGLEEELQVATLGAGLAHGLFSLACPHFFLAHKERELTLLHVEADAIARTHPGEGPADRGLGRHVQHDRPGRGAAHAPVDRKSTRLNSSHGYISYAVFCMKK